jgi:hypothetical protein
MFEYEDIDITISQYVNNSIKREIWLKTRNKLTKIFIYCFFEQLEYAAELHKTCDKFLTNEELKTIDLAQLGAAYIKIQNLKNDKEDPFKFLYKIQELFLSTSGQILLNDEVRGQLYESVVEWINSFKICLNLNCNNQCSCMCNWFNRGMKFFDKHYKFDNLMNEENPVMIYFDCIFGTLINRISIILKEIDDYLPCYSILYQSSPANLLMILQNNQKEFQLNFKNGYLYFFVAEEENRFGNKTIVEPISNLWDLN